eukprot:gene15543-17417_t
MMEDDNSLWQEQIEISFQDYDLSPTSPTEEKLIQICSLNQPFPNYSNFPSVETATPLMDQHRTWAGPTVAPNPWWSPYSYQTWPALDTSFPEEDPQESYEYGDEIDLQDISPFSTTESSSRTRPTLLSTLLELPLQIIEETVTDFLDPDSWFNLVVTAKALSEIKKRTVFWRLNVHFSVQYYLNPDWRDLFLQRIHNPEKQVYLNLSGRVWISPSLSEVDDDAKKNPKGGKEHPLTKEQIYLQRVNHVHHLDISHNCGLKDVSPLTNVYRIHAANCPDLVDISGLQNCHSVDLSHCPKISDYTPIRNITSLLARGNLQIDDTAVFANIRRLDLSECSNIHDVSPLKNVPTLKLSNCEKVTNFHALTNNEFLNISRNKTLRYLPAITSKTILLKVNDCPNIERLDPLWQRFLSTTTEEEEDSYISPLKLTQSSTSVPISSLKSFHPSVDDLSSAERTGRTTFGDTVSSLTSVETTNAMVSEGCSTVSEEFESVHENSELRYLWLVGCHNLRSLEGLTHEHFPKLETIYICRCMKILAKFPFVRKRLALYPCKNKKRVVSELRERRSTDLSFPRYLAHEELQPVCDEGPRRGFDAFERHTVHDSDPDNCRTLLFEIQHPSRRFTDDQPFQALDDDKMTINL